MLGGPLKLELMGLKAGAESVASLRGRNGRPSPAPEFWLLAPTPSDLHPFDVCAQATELLVDELISAIDMVDPVDLGLTFRL